MIWLYVLKAVAISHAAAAEIILAAVKAERRSRLTVGGVVEIALFGSASLEIFVVSVAVIAAKISAVIVSKSIWHLVNLPMCSFVM